MLTTVIPGPDVALIFHSNHPPPQTHAGFKANVQLNECGGVRGADNESEGGMLLSPNYPNKYNPNDFCMWLIAVQPGKVISLTFTAFQLAGPSTHSPVKGSKSNLHQQIISKLI